MLNQFTTKSFSAPEDGVEKRRPDLVALALEQSLISSGFNKAEWVKKLDEIVAMKVRLEDAPPTELSAFNTDALETLERCINHIDQRTFVGKAYIASVTKAARATEEERVRTVNTAKAEAEERARAAVNAAKAEQEAAERAKKGEAAVAAELERLGRERREASSGSSAIIIIIVFFIVLFFMVMSARPH
jgi:ABC-type Na+ efflux pump permease subunit